MSDPAAGRGLVWTIERDEWQRREATPVLIDGPGDLTTAAPRLTGSAVLLREVELGDAPVLLEKLSDPEVVRHISAPPVTLDRFEQFVQWSWSRRREGRSVCFSIVPESEPGAAGIAQLNVFDPAGRRAEWGLVLGTQHWGSGLFLDVSRLLLHYMFGPLNLSAAEAWTAEANVRANAAMRKLGGQCAARWPPPTFDAPPQG